MKDNRVNLRLGTASELKVAADLTERGYEVFHPMNSNSSCDFIVIKEGKVYRVEVKSLKLSLDSTSKQVESLRAKADILATVVDTEIFYYPLLERLP